MTEPRAVLIVVMLLLLPFGLYHRIKSQSTGEKLDRRQEGLFILATLRPLGAVFWFSVFAWMINPALDGLVFGVASDLVAVDWRRCSPDRRCAARVDLPISRNEPD